MKTDSLFDQLYDLLTEAFHDPLQLVVLEALMAINGFRAGMIDFLAYSKTGDYNMSVSEAITYVKENLIYYHKED